MNILYVSDLDGTLITSQECVSPYSIDIINRLVANGLRFTYATARSLTTSLKATAGLKNNYPVIVYNGALIVDPVTKEIIHSVTFGENLKNYILSTLFSLGVYPVTYSMIDGKEKFSWVVGKETVSMGRYLQRRQTDDRLNPVYDSEELKRGDVFYFNCMGEASLIHKAYEALSRDARITCLLTRETYQSDYWCEIMCYNATKAEAVKKLKEIGSYDKVVCFGDSINDIPMFDFCDEKYAVMNADDSLKKLATGVIGYCEEDGVAKWLNEYSGYNR